MPQFDITSYLSQSFWMLVSFGGLFLVVALAIFPAWEDTLEKRQRIMKKNLKEAADVNARADELMRDYKERMFSVEQEKNKRVKDRWEEIQKEALRAEEVQDKLLREKIQTNERQAAEKQEAINAGSEALAEKIARQLADKLLPLKN